MAFFPVVLVDFFGEAGVGDGFEGGHDFVPCVCADFSVEGVDGFGGSDFCSLDRKSVV